LDQHQNWTRTDNGVITTGIWQPRQAHIAGLRLRKPRPFDDNLGALMQVKTVARYARRLAQPKLHKNNHRLPTCFVRHVNFGGVRFGGVRRDKCWQNNNRFIVFAAL